ncbi:cobalt ABC transporter ATP-binding protein [Bacillus canaveralius]|uniref:Cobalt ABC transporter ATP-binding protein n=1 Tax=Bacillus canaveralius TaxID=1403243 RepID=A0A2N5GSK8_9BACI|nr:ATP-binding cassette domain-containing protein [Bacillus canaveralius]PLR86743.1 cobalt ABC transporter ATP-binding protein [Bacillus canaveralius]PLR92795.1 cobalt ABC transporter ATP-binding protein [Bacillus canaveralius]
MIKVSNLSFSYQQGSPILSAINLDFDTRTTAIIGQNGAGKTTFVKLLKGLLKPYGGEIFIQNLRVNDSTAAELAKTIGLVFQNPNEQIFKRNVLDEAMFGPLNIKMSTHTARQKAIEALEMVGLNDKLEVNPHDLSLSEKKLLCIASVVAMDTDIIIFDEPTIAQDHAGKERIRNIINTLKEKNKLVMTIIHDMDFVAENFERTIVLNEGKVILDGDTRSVFASKEILKNAHVEAPGITQLGEKLGYKETFLSVEEFIKMYKHVTEKK